MASSQVPERPDLPEVLQALSERLDREIEFDEGLSLEAFCSWVQRAVRRLAGRSLRATHDEEDLRQEALVAILSSVERLGSEGAEDAGAWLRTVVRSRLVDLSRRRGARGRESLERRFLEDLSPIELERAVAYRDEDHLVYDELTLLFDDQLELLPSEQRFALELRVKHGESIADLARRMERSEEAIRQLLHRARRKLRERLDASSSVDESAS